MRRFAELAFAPVDEGGAHAVALGADAIKSMVGDEQAAGSISADDLRSAGIGFPVGFEISRFFDRNDMIERKPDMRFGRV